MEVVKNRRDHNRKEPFGVGTDLGEVESMEVGS